MSDETMSQDEINDLLGSIAGEADSGLGSDEETDSTGNGPRIMIYDFVRPDLFSESLHERFLASASLTVEEACASLGHLIGQEVTGTISSVDRLTADELMRCLPNPSAIVPLSFHQGGKGALVFTKPFASTLTRLFMGLPSETGGLVPDVGSDQVLKGSFVKLADTAFLSAIKKHLSWCETKPLRQEPEVSILGDPLEMVLVLSAGISLPASGGSETASFVFPGHLMAAALSAGALSGERRTGGAGDEDSTDFLVNAEITFPVLLGEERILEALQSEGAVVPVDPRIMGIMSYEKRREEK